MAVLALEPVIRTDVGRRANNEDAAFASERLAAVADGGYLLTNVGDSRTYLFRDGELTQLTRDDSLVQWLIDRGEISAEDADRHPHRSVVLAALDGSPREPAAVVELEARLGDRLLLCSDGLSDVVGERAIVSALAGMTSKRACAQHLIELALDTGGRDNISVVIADVVPARGCLHDGWSSPQTSRGQGAPSSRNATSST